MNMQDIIVRKRDGRELGEDEIRWMVRAFTEGTIPDYQMAAWLMAVYFQKLSEKETFILTDAMRTSGDTADLSGIPGIKVDKHSTGGVGDKTTLVVLPIAAAAGVPCAKMSGRGLGFSGGTADKLEAIPGYKTSIPEERFFRQVRNIGIALITQTGQITPADKKIYALRDVTGTVENQSLIASSIMSKKLAAGSDAIVLDVKCGRGAFMKDVPSAVSLAEEMVKIGKSAGKKMKAFITDMDQPLGYMVGNALEVREAVDTLKGNGPSDLTSLSISLAGAMIFLGGRAETSEEGEKNARELLSDGSALRKFQELVLAQDGDPAFIDHPDLLPQPEAVREVVSGQDGFVTDVDAYKIGVLSRESGAGREEKGDSIDLAAGIELRRKKGDPVRKGDIIAKVYGKEEKIEGLPERIAGAYSFGPEKPGKDAMIKKVI
ncbi:MAG: thymidine phosphorylase [Eubacteriales bacterium]|nr:thymidine phosphorylase [Eubacteriales bacterium]